MDSLEARISRLLDQLEDPDLSDAQELKLTRKVRFLRSLQRDAPPSAVQS